MEYLFLWGKKKKKKTNIYEYICISILIIMLNYDRLARVYTSMAADVKRIVLRLVEGPVRSLGMGSPQLLALVENCPKGSETLVTRIIHILTEKCMLSLLIDKIYLFDFCILHVCMCSCSKYRIGSQGARVISD